MFSPLDRIHSNIYSIFHQLKGTITHNRHIWLYERKGKISTYIESLTFFLGAIWLAPSSSSCKDPLFISKECAAISSAASSLTTQEPRKLLQVQSSVCHVQTCKFKIINSYTYFTVFWENLPHLRSILKDLRPQNL